MANDFFSDATRIAAGTKRIVNGEVQDQRRGGVRRLRSYRCGVILAVFFIKSRRGFAGFHKMAKNLIKLFRIGYNDQHPHGRTTATTDHRIDFHTLWPIRRAHVALVALRSAEQTEQSEL